MSGRAFGALVLAFLGLSVAVVEILYQDVVAFEGVKLVITIHGKVVASAFLVAVAAFMFSLYDEVSRGTREIRSSFNQVEQVYGEISHRFDERHEEIKRSYNQIANSFMIYPSVRNLIQPHFDNLGHLCFLLNQCEPNSAMARIYGSYIEFWFQNFIDRDVSNLITEISGNQLNLRSESQKLFHSFLWLFFDSVKEHGEIRVTSIVDADPFWLQAQHYLRRQALLIEQKSVEIYRYFLWVENHKQKLDEHREHLQASIKNGILTRVVLFLNRKEAGQYYQDIGYVDDLVGIRNTVQGGSIEETRCYLRQTGSRYNQNIDEISLICRELEDNRHTVKSDSFPQNIKGFLQAVEKGIEDLTGASV